MYKKDKLCDILLIKGEKMNNYNIEYIVKIVLNVLIIGLILYVVAKLFIFLLPVIIVLIILYYVYRIYIVLCI